MAKAKGDKFSADDLDLVSDIDDTSDDSIGDDLREALAAQQAVADEPEPAEVGAEAASDAEDEEGDADADGDDDAADDDAEEVEAAPEEAASPGVQAPEHWAQADKDFLASLPDDKARKILLDMRKRDDRAVHAKFGEIAEIRKNHEGFENALRPIEAQLTQAGISKADAVRRLVGAHQGLTQDVGQGLAQIASQYAQSVAGTDRARDIVRQVAQALGVAEQADPHEGNGQADPNADPVRSEINALKSQLTAFEQQQREAQAQATQAGITTAQRKVTAFTEAAGEDGQLLHPHFERVRGAMSLAVQTAHAAGEDLSLEDAYDRAVWMDPELRKEMTAAEIAKVKSEQEAAAKQATQKRREHAARAGRAKTPRTSNVSAEPPSDQPLKDDLRDAYRELANGAT